MQPGSCPSTSSLLEPRASTVMSVHLVEPMDAHKTPSNHRQPIALAEKVIDPELLPDSKTQGLPLADEPPNAFKHHQKSPATGLAWIFIVLSVLSSTFLFALDNTVVADLQPVIVERFQGTAKLPWVSVAFAMGGVSVNLLWSENLCKLLERLLTCIQGQALRRIRQQIYLYCSNIHFRSWLSHLWGRSIHECNDCG